MDVRLKSSSHLFKKWITDMDDVLSKTQTHAIDGSMTQQDDEHFKIQRSKLASTKVDIYSAPVFPVNEWLAQDLVQDEIECKSYEQDLDKTMGDNR
jgi:hypothetical protein|tara:strand:- start:1341 stop:1628 length:288 start_codon:yes stop_codon:yes gene_type:complete